MEFINAPTQSEKKKLLTASVRGEVSRDLVTQCERYQMPMHNVC